MSYLYWTSLDYGTKELILWLSVSYAVGLIVLLYDIRKDLKKPRTLQADFWMTRVKWYHKLMLVLMSPLFPWIYLFIRGGDEIDSRAKARADFDFEQMKVKSILTHGITEEDLKSIREAAQKAV